ncbi:MAG: hypothetical protein Q4F31_05425 [Eubacteriales bacterium]|nr:hypothetical protein [Eubacteriales bacterium]
MSPEYTIAVIVEGEKFEKIAFSNIMKNFFNKRLGKTSAKVIQMPAEQNIYMLWKAMKEDNFDSDIIEVIRGSSPEAEDVLKGFSRNDFSEVYLFFDYDAHQNNLKGEQDPETVIQEMLQSFDNETENGKLFISYPMSEALRDMVKGSCRPFTGECYIQRKYTGYKNASGAEGNKSNQVKKYTFSDWCYAINAYRARLSCLTGEAKILPLSDCRKYSPGEIYAVQRKKIEENDTIAVLSAFPEFLVEYFKEGELDGLLHLTEKESIGEYLQCPV